MRIGLSFFPVRPALLLSLAQRADELGYESLWLPEHLVFPSTIHSQYPYDPTLGPPLPTTPLYDPLITLAFIAAQTRQIQLGTAVYILNLRHPLIAAKLIATLDALAGGRVLIGVGAGWLKEEFDTIGASWQHRGTRLEESIAIMRRLWTQARITHEGRFYRFDEVGFEPKPTRAPVPIFIGGETPMALKRAACIGDGWMGLNHTPDSAAARVRELRAMHAGDKPFEISVGPEFVPSVDDIRRFSAAGVDRIVLNARLFAGDAKGLEAMLGNLDRFAETIMHRANE
jgi:probable F420-dependent oxidoreductase